MATIKIPKPSKVAYNPDRPLHKNLLILKQVEHFHHVDERLPEPFRTHTKLEDIQTEGQAGAYIARVTRAIHESGGTPAEKVRRAT